MEIDILPWVSMALRWLHLIAGIAWIGSSFYFIWLDNSLRPEADEKEAGVTGGLWAVHGGGFYHKKKYTIAPDHLPDTLHWFKWEAYVTWLSGIGLLVLLYYWQADLYLIDPSKIAFGQWSATGFGLGILAAGWIFYDGTCRLFSKTNSLVSGGLWFAFLVLGAFVLSKVFTDRGAFIHVGAMIGTAMAANVFLIIIPNQKKVVASMLNGEQPKAELLRMAKQRSVHNNYMTLPVLLIMVSSHYPNITSHPLNWLLLALLSLSGIIIRHFFNLRHKGKVLYPILLVGVGLFVLTMIFASLSDKKLKPAFNTVSFNEVQEIIQRNCTACHSANPTHSIFRSAPMGLALDSREDIEKYSDGIYQRAVISKTMPMGKDHNMSDEDRQKLGVWIENLRSGS